MLLTKRIQDLNKDKVNRLWQELEGIDLPKNKRGVIGLTYIYGIGHSFAKSILCRKQKYFKKTSKFRIGQMSKVNAIQNNYRR